MVFENVRGWDDEKPRLISIFLTRHSKVWCYVEQCWHSEDLDGRITTYKPTIIIWLHSLPHLTSMFSQILFPYTPPSSPILSSLPLSRIIFSFLFMLLFLHFLACLSLLMSLFRTAACTFYFTHNSSLYLSHFLSVPQSLPLSLS